MAFCSPRFRFVVKNSIAKQQKEYTEGLYMSFYLIGSAIATTITLGILVFVKEGREEKDEN